jgi:hypothetical protein
LQYLEGHRSIKVKEIITQVMILRLLLTVNTCTRKTCILCGYDGRLWPQICKKRKRLHNINKLSCINKGLTR